MLSLVSKASKNTAIVHVLKVAASTSDYAAGIVVRWHRRRRRQGGGGGGFSWEYVTMKYRERCKDVLKSTVHVLTLAKVYHHCHPSLLLPIISQEAIV